ncbi:uncharacterized protein TNCV_3939141 [Trichonephila clavipes]|nr:uncharacterized protein TNCV_3939141 [Trichonephila clavipes]
MYPLYMIVGSRGQGKILHQGDRFLGCDKALLRRKTVDPLSPDYCRLRCQWCQTRVHLGISYKHCKSCPDCKFVRQSDDSNHCAAIYERYLRSVFQQDNPHTTVVTQHALPNMLFPWPVISPNLSPIELLWNIIGRQSRRHPQHSLTVSVLNGCMFVRLHARSLVCMIALKILAYLKAIHI